jgi:hypothetical protein
LAAFFNGEPTRKSSHQRPASSITLQNSKRILFNDYCAKMGKIDLLLLEIPIRSVFILNFRGQQSVPVFPVQSTQRESPSHPNWNNSLPKILLLQQNRTTELARGTNFAA